MEDLNYENELKSLRSLVVRLAMEIDYKNHLLMEKDEKDTSLLLSENAEKDKLIDEKYEVVSGLKAEKERLIEETRTLTDNLNQKQQKLDEICGGFSLLIAENTKKDVLIEEKERLLNETSESLNKLKVEKEKLVVENTEKEKLIEEISTATRNLMAEKDQFLEAYLRGSSTIEKMKLEIENLQLCLDSKNTEIEIMKKEQNTMVLQTEFTELVKIEPDLQLAEIQNCTMKNIKELENLRAEVNVLRKELEEKAEALQNLEMDNRTLTVKEIRSNHEMQAARRAAVESLQGMQRKRVNIGIKRIGEVDQKPFREACSERYSSGNWDEEFGNWEQKSMELCSLWQKNISDPGWQPFKHEDINGKLTEVIDENDQSLKELREEWGEEPYEAVVKALLGVNEYNASGRYPVSELWNFKENKRATLGEVIQYVIKQWRNLKKK